MNQRPRPQPWLKSAAHRRWLQSHTAELIAFGRRVVHPRGGAANLDDVGSPLTAEPVQLWITGRMLHVYALATLLGIPGSRPIAQAMLDALRGRLVDHVHGGWFSGVDAQDRPVNDQKSSYDHAFVVLGASSAVSAGIAGGEDLLAEVTEVVVRRFWDEDAGMCVDMWSGDWAQLDDYRGINANMHMVEAMLAVADVTGDELWARRAQRIGARVAQLAAANEWRVPEHFDSRWQPLLDFNADRPDDAFKPFGATVGHGIEWARLLIQLASSPGVGKPAVLIDAAIALFDRAVADGWSVDGADGFVYTTDWEGAPVSRERMHWVVAEAISCAAVLYRHTGERRFADRYEQWWDYAACYLIDPDSGSWHHQLDTQNRPAVGTWSGKPDLYHAVQATLIPFLPTVPSLSVSLAAGE